MGNKLLIVGVTCLAAGAAFAVEATIISYEGGELSFSLNGSGTVTVTSQVDFKYISVKTGAESLARATSEPMKIKLAGEETPATIMFIPPDGSIVEVEVVIFVNDKEITRETFYY
ncbi:MAG: hypothetical protein V3W11_13205 [bacterium]